MSFKKGDKVIHKTKNKEWGAGLIIEIPIPGDNKIKIFFEHHGDTTIVDPTKLKLAPEVQSTLLENLLLINPTKHYLSTSNSIASFIQKYPKGFDDAQYLIDERDYIYENHIHALSILDKSKFSTLLKKKKYNDIYNKVKGIISYKAVSGKKITYFHKMELIKFHEALKDKTNQKLFSENLFNLLYGKDKIHDRFNQYSTMLSDLDINNWPMTTFFIFIIDPTQYMLMRPRCTMKISELFRYDIQYKSIVNFNTYKKVLSFSEYLKNELARLNPKDMIDIYAFMWWTFSKYNI